jgi:hypothetical protein
MKHLSRLRPYERKNVRLIIPNRLWIVAIVLVACAVLLSGGSETKCPEFAEIMGLRLENQSLRAQLAWANQELEIWNNIPIAEVRIAKLKAEQAEKVFKDQMAARAKSAAVDSAGDTK